MADDHYTTNTAPANSDEIGFAKEVAISTDSTVFHIDGNTYATPEGEGPTAISIARGVWKVTFSVYTENLTIGDN